MTAIETWDVAVIGAGPAGLAAALAAREGGARVCLVEREHRPGGILKQCIHDGFGLVRFREKLSGPEYAWRDIRAVREQGIQLYTDTFLLNLERVDDVFCLILQNSERAVFRLEAKALVAATGCRERTARQVLIHGERPAGIYTAGTVQRLINIDGHMPGKNCVILGSGDIGLIMARRLVLEGAKVEGVYEIKGEPSGLTRNVVQCLDDYGIPLHLNTTVTKVHGSERVEGVTISTVDDSMKPVPGTERHVPCDTLVLSVGLIPENDILHALGVEIDRRTGGPVVDQLMRTSVPGLFSCGNALHVNDLVDYVSESGTTAGSAAANYALGREAEFHWVPVKFDEDIHYVVPQLLDLASAEPAILYFRVSRARDHAVLELKANKEVLVRKKYPVLRPPEMERIVLDLEKHLILAKSIEISIRG